MPSTITAKTADAAQPPDEHARRRLVRSRKFAFKAMMILAPFHIYVAWRLLPDLPAAPGVQVFGAIFLLCSAFLIPFGTLAMRFVDNGRLADRLTWMGGVTMGWFSSLVILVLLRDMALVIPGLRVWHGESAKVVLLLSLLVTAIGFANARRTARVNRVSVALDNLPPALEGFTIAQITDLHIGPTIKAAYVRGVVERVNGLGADVVAITGDSVDGRVDRLAADAAPLAGLRARHGVYVVTGNHEYYSGAEAWMEHFRGLGLRTLMNQHVVIERDGARLVLAGINDFSAVRYNPALASDPVAALNGSPEGAPRILLAHQPRSALAAEPAGFDLQISGHTHGGQFWPWNHFVRLQQPFTAGLHRLGRLQVYTSRGTGYWGPPKRFGAPSEITLITLTAA